MKKLKFAQFKLIFVQFFVTLVNKSKSNLLKVQKVERKSIISQKNNEIYKKTLKNTLIKGLESRKKLDNKPEK